VVNLGETRRVPFHKSRDENRLVCFCFKHSVATIKADVEKNNESTIRTSIKAQCKEGLDDCERRNPQGRCCLGHVGQVVKQATSNAAHQEHHVESETELCGALKEKTSDAFSSTKNDSVTHSSLLVSVGASATAMLSSACCWLPLVAIGLGASSAGVGAFFEAWRGPLLLMTVILLGAGFYLVYRTPRCTPGDVCEVPNPHTQRIGRKAVWLTTAFVITFAFFPEYVGALTQGNNELAQTGSTQIKTHYQVKGMTCAGCEGHAHDAIQAIPRVVSVTVSYRDASAEVVWIGEPDHTAIADAVAAFGYHVNPLD